MWNNAPFYALFLRHFYTQPFQISVKIAAFINKRDHSTFRYISDKKEKTLTQQLLYPF
jgi:hypothetical protein